MTLRSLACSLISISDISSRRSVPPPANSNLPALLVTAPVKAPRSYPKSSDSRRFSGIAAQFIATKGLEARGLFSWTSSAISSLPVPLSPCTSTVALLCATVFASWISSFILRSDVMISLI